MSNVVSQAAIDEEYADKFQTFEERAAGVVTGFSQISENITYANKHIFCDFGFSGEYLDGALTAIAQQCFEDQVKLRIDPRAGSCRLIVVYKPPKKEVPLVVVQQPPPPPGMTWVSKIMICSTIIVFLAIALGILSILAGPQIITRVNELLSRIR